MIFDPPHQVWSHAWKGQEIVLFVTYDLSGDTLKATVGLPLDLLSSSPKSNLRTVVYSRKELEQKSLIALSSTHLETLNHRLKRDLRVIANGQEQPPSLTKIDLILNHPQTITDRQKQLLRTWNQTQIETHSGAQNALVISLDYPVANHPSLKKVQFLWQSPDWFIKSSKKRNPKRQLTSKSVSGLVIDRKEITPITFTPLEPEVIWRAPQQVASYTKYKQPQKSQKSWWSTMKAWFLGRSPPHSASSLAKTFKTLHRGIYKAFDEEQDERAYHALSMILSGEMLDQVFQSTYSALVLRDQGGARAKITHVIPIKLEPLTKPQLPPSFLSSLSRPKNEPQVFFRYQWRIVGQVTHWEHIHRRVNDYVAIYAMSQVNQEWKFTSVHPLSQKRRPELEGAM